MPHFSADDTMTGSMADVPKDLADEIHKLEKIFNVDTAKLKEVTDHFVSELAKGKYKESVASWTDPANLHSQVSVLRVVAS